MTDLILGLGNLEFKQIEPFLASLRRTSFTGAVCFFVHDMSEEEMRRVTEEGALLESGRRFITPGRHLMNSRFFMYLDFLSRTIGQYDRVMLTDVRDVIFQSDPFLSIGSEDLRYACERALIGDCPINTSWLNNVYPHGVSENLRSCLISCAGTTIGSTGGILRYLSAMVDEMSRCPCLDMNIDQAIHNYIVRMRPLQGALVDEQDLLTATLNHMPEGSLVVTDAGVEIDGRLPAVVHQWDRRHAVAQRVGDNSAFRLAGTPARPGRPPDDCAARPNHRNDGRPSPDEPTNLAAGKVEVVVAYVSSAHGCRPRRFLREVRECGFRGKIILCARDDDLLAQDLVLTPEQNVEIAWFAAEEEWPDSNAAHIGIAHALRSLSADVVLTLDSVCCRMQSNVFDHASTGAALFAEGNILVGDCATNTHWVSRFGRPSPDALRHPIISSSAVLGPLPQVRAFYAAVLELFEGRTYLMTVDKVVQGAFNIIAAECPSAHAIHPNGAVTYLDVWPSRMLVEPGLLVRVGGVMPAIVLRPARDPADAN